MASPSRSIRRRPRDTIESLSSPPAPPPLTHSLSNFTQLPNDVHRVNRRRFIERDAFGACGPSFRFFFFGCWGVDFDFVCSSRTRRLLELGRDL